MKAIAVVGISCRFPEASGPDAFWQLIKDRRDAISLISKDRLEKSQLFAQLSPETLERFYGGFLKDIDQFDPRFFHISDREAIHIDPQQRLLLAVCWEAFENAGIVPHTLKGTKTGIFVGCQAPEYGLRAHMFPELASMYTGTGNSISILANRISYQLDLRGPSLSVDTACSSSLVAVHLACQSLQEQESELAVAAGVNIILSPLGKTVFDHSKAMAADGRCKPFDSQADGFVRSEGIGAVVLKPLEKAIADNDPIYAVIRGSAVNQDGRTNGIMAPNRWAQEQVLRSALADAEVAPQNVQYVECHGTGTLLGDPIEATALGTVYSDGREAKDPLRIGSVKSNIGHMETAAGIGGLIKVALALRHGLIPPSIHFHQPNPYIPFNELKLKVQTELTPWNASGQNQPIAGVSSFGFGGTNAHVVLEAPPRRNDKKVKLQPAAHQIFLLSAQTPAGLKNYAQSYAGFLNSNPNPNHDETSLHDICKTAACRRTHFDNRFALVTRNTEELKAALMAYSQQNMRLPENLTPVKRVGPVFVFSGQGSQWAGMGRSLFKTEKVFRECLKNSDAAILATAGWSLIDELNDPLAAFENKIERIQPILFAISVALAAQWRHWGIEPSATIGHSMGEVAAAHVAGILTLEEAARVICRRSQLMATLKTGGAMLVTELSAAEGAALIVPYDGAISIAAHNSARSTVLSGDRKSLENLMAKLEAKDIFVKFAKVDVASHSSQVEPLRELILNECAALKPRQSNIPFFSTVFAQKLDGPELDADYWYKNLRQPVLFHETIAKISQDNKASVFIELSPHPVLTTSIEQTASGLALPNIMSLPSLKRQEDENENLLKTAAALFNSGYTLNWNHIFEQEANVTPLPTYPWQNQKYWLDDSQQSQGQVATAKGLLGVEIDSPDSKNRRSWQVNLNGGEFKYFFDHKVMETPIFPGTGYVEMVHRAAQETFKDKNFVIKNLQLHKAYFLKAEVDPHFQVTFAAIHSGGCEFKIHSVIQSVKKNSKGETYWSLHCSGQIDLKTVSYSEDPASVPNLDLIRARTSREISHELFYETLVTSGNHYGPSFRAISKVWCADEEVIAEITPPASVTNLSRFTEDYQYQPALFDSCLQALFGITHFQPHQDTRREAYWPVSVGEIRSLQPCKVPKYSYGKVTKVTSSTGEHYVGDVHIFDDQCRLVSTFLNIKCEKVTGVGQNQKIIWPRRREDWLYKVKWVDAKTLETETRQGVEHPAQAPFSLVFADKRGIGELLAAKLRASKQRCLVISTGGEFTKLGPDHWQINANRVEDYAKLLEQVKAEISTSTSLHIAHLWGLDLVNETSPDQSYVPAQSLLFLLKNLEQHHKTLPYKFDVVTQGAQAIEPRLQPDIHIFQAPLWGLCRSLAEEQQNNFGFIIDLDQHDTAEEAASKLYAEFNMRDGEKQIAYNGTRRLLPQLSRRPPSGKFELPVLLRPDRTYLLTGGLGNLGYLTAQWLIQRGARRILIIGRSMIPPRTDWHRENQNPHVKTIVELENQGCQIDYRAFDIADSAPLAKILVEYKNMNYAPIAGVIHAAGVVFAKAFTEMTGDELNGVLKSKIQGTYNLHQLIPNGPLDFFVTYSSFSAWMGSPFLAVYAAGNAFLDALAHQRRLEGKTALVVNWATWQEETVTKRQIRGTYNGVGLIPRDSGMNILESLISENDVQAGVGVLNWKILREAFPAMARSSFFKNVMAEVENEKTGLGPDHPKASASNAAVVKTELADLDQPARRKLVENYLVESVAKAVRRQPGEISRHQPLNTLGLDSLIALEIKNAIAKDFGVTVPVVFLLKGPSLLDLAEVIMTSVNTLTQPKSAAHSENQSLAVDIDKLNAHDIEKLLELFSPNKAKERKGDAA